MVQGEGPWEEEEGDATEQLADLNRHLLSSFSGSHFCHHGVSSCGTLSWLLYMSCIPKLKSTDCLHNVNY